MYYISRVKRHHLHSLTLYLSLTTKDRKLTNLEQWENWNISVLNAAEKNNLDIRLVDHKKWINMYDCGISANEAVLKAKSEIVNKQGISA